MPVTSQIIQHSRVITITGELDPASAPKLIAAVDISDTARLVLDLTDVTFMDSSGLGAVLYAWRYAREAGGRLLIVCPVEAYIRRTFARIGVAKWLTICHSLDDALTAR